MAQGTQELDVDWLCRYTTPALRLLALGMLAFGCAQATEPPTAVMGSIDLANWDFDAAGNVLLDGDWAVCWGQLLEPSARACPTGWKTIRRRMLWSVDAAASPFGGKGVATYRLRLLLPPDDRQLSLRAGAPFTAARIWLDGVERERAGIVGSSAETTVSGSRSLVTGMPLGKSEVELQVQIANFEFRGGGLRRPWLVGRPNEIQAWIGRGMLRDVILTTVTVVVGLGYLLQFALRPREFSRGYFALLSLFIGLRAIPASISGFSELIVPWASFSLLLRWEYAGIGLAIYAATGYIRNKVPDVLPDQTMRALQAVGLAIVPIVLLAPIPIVLETLPIYLVLPPVLLGIVIISYGRAYLRGTPGVGATLAACIVYIGIVAHDIVRTQTGLGSQLELFPYFIVIWILNEAYELAQAFSRSFDNVESLSNELLESNFELQETESAVVRFVPFDLLRLLGKRSIRDIAAGDNIRSQMTVVYCEFHGLPATLEGMRADDAFRFMNSFLGRLSNVVERHGGFVNPYQGNGLQALFPDKADNAVAAAIELHASIREFNRQGASVHRPRVELGIGVDRGELLLGTVGGDQHLSGGVVGGAIRRAQQIESLTRLHDAALLISSTTRKALSDPSNVVLRELGEVELRPGAERATVLEVVLEARDAG